MIIRAAVKVHMNDGRDIMISCHRHCDAYEILHNFGYSYTDYRRDMEGFLTDDGRFLDRVEAAAYAYECGQITHEEYDALEISCLFSEDLW